MRLIEVLVGVGDAGRVRARAHAQVVLRDCQRKRRSASSPCLPAPQSKLSPADRHAPPGPAPATPGPNAPDAPAHARASTTPTARSRAESDVGRHHSTYCRRNRRS